MLRPKRAIVFLPPPPDGVRMGGLRSEPSNGPIRDSLFCLVEVAKPIAAGIVARFIYERVCQYDAERIKINGQEPVDRADFDRIVSESIEVGKND
jgi:hypothetical protein